MSLVALTLHTPSPHSQSSPSFLLSSIIITSRVSSSISSVQNIGVSVSTVFFYHLNFLIYQRETLTHHHIYYLPPFHLSLKLKTPNFFANQMLLMAMTLAINTQLLVMLSLLLVALYSINPRHNPEQLLVPPK